MYFFFGGGCVVPGSLMHICFSTTTMRKSEHASRSVGTQAVRRRPKKSDEEFLPLAAGVRHCRVAANSRLQRAQPISEIAGVSNPAVHYQNVVESRQDFFLPFRLAANGRLTLLW